jgi:replicative DNA helicase|tara:strand:+ start:298 stop:1719 length:1422 start_codon:yes stop_codon:yes gene_type:complete
MIETTVLSNLIFNESYYRKVYPYIKDEYFDDQSMKKIFSTYSEYVEQYKAPPSIEALKISLDKRKDMSEDSYTNVMTMVDTFKSDENTDYDFLVNETEKFCQDKDLFNSIRKAILIMDGEDKDNDKGSIPNLLSDSLGISFDTSVGHDFIEDSDERYEFYHRKEERMPFDIDLLNKITKGGLPRKSLTVLLATTGGGKSLVKCHAAASYLMTGKNCLYITMEMAEERVAERIDANMMDITLDDLKLLPRDVYQKRMARIKSKCTGQLVIKEYPTGSAHAGHFRHLLNELKLKKNFTPDVIFIDYLNICASSRIKGAAAANSYTLVKSIAEEIRGLAMEYNCAVVSSSQFNRDGYGNSDVDLTNTSESMGITHTADCIIGLVTTEELDNLGQLMMKQLKNRWGALDYYRRFVVGIDRSKMQIFDLEDSAQRGIGGQSAANTASFGNARDASPAFDNSKFGSGSKKTMFSAGGIS